MTTKRRDLVLIVAVISVATGCGNSVLRSTTLSKHLESASKPSPTNSTSLPPIDPAKYNEVRTKVDAVRGQLFRRYERATTSDERLVVINEAREQLTRLIYKEIFPYWYGTGWDFNGTTETPGQGKIACGYFVSTVLRDAGLKVQRAKMAQQASERIVLSLTGDVHIKRFRNVPITDFVRVVQNWGPGLYVVGLDIHTGFILNIDGDVYFIHSSYMDPYTVVKQRAVESRILSDSKYRVLGKMSEDDQLIMKWLTGESIVTRV